MNTTCFDRPVRFYLESYGCSFNLADAETMRALLSAAGCTEAACPEEAALIVVNSCTVKDRTTLELRKRLAALRALPQSPTVVLCGCAPRIPSQRREFGDFAMVGPDTLDALPEVAAAALAGRVTARIERRTAVEARLSLPHKRINAAVEIVPIAQGCQGSCTYCQTVIARGRLASARVSTILGRIDRALDEGIRQFWLTAQDCGAYGLDIGTDLPSLMHTVARLIEERGPAVSDAVRVRVGMANPNHLRPWLDDFAGALAHPCFYKFAHIPVQCGSDAVLRAMCRPYTVDEYRDEVAALRRALPSISIATDIIVGFPGESDGDFAQTLALMRELAPSVINRSRYSPRPHTPAARMEQQVPVKVVSARSQQLARLHEQIIHADLSALVGRTVRVMVEVNNLGRTDAYKPVALSGAFPLAGQCVDVLLTGVDRFHLTGAVVR